MKFISVFKAEAGAEAKAEAEGPRPQLPNGPTLQSFEKCTYLEFYFSNLVQQDKTHVNVIV